jgi:hypothetical protein
MGTGPRYANPSAHLRTRDLVVQLARRGRAFSATSLQEDFEISAGDAHRRIQYMLLWGCCRGDGTRKRKGRRGRHEKMYRITEHGNDCAASWSEGKRRSTR